MKKPWRTWRRGGGPIACAWSGSWVNTSRAATRIAYVPEPLRTPASQATFVPYIYSEDEVRALLAAAARLAPPGALRGPTYQTLLGLLYSTGLRIGEAMALNLADFHRDEARLYICPG